MNKILFYILPVALISSLIMMCSSPAEKVNTAQQEVNQANKDLEKANQEYQQDILNYKKENETRIATNDQLISDFKVRIANEKKAVKDEYNKKIAELEQKTPIPEENWMNIKLKVKKNGRASNPNSTEIWMN